MNDVVYKPPRTERWELFCVCQWDGTIVLKHGLRRFAYELGFKLWSQTKVWDWSQWKIKWRGHQSCREWVGVSHESCRESVRSGLDRKRATTWSTLLSAAEVKWSGGGVSACVRRSRSSVHACRIAEYSAALCVLPCALYSRSRPR